MKELVLSERIPPDGRSSERLDDPDPRSVQVSSLAGEKGGQEEDDHIAKCVAFACISVAA